jgi:translation initiation factor 2B subunit (eIF-2B alpha/beta/delta family)
MEQTMTITQRRIQTMSYLKQVIEQIKQTNFPDNSIKKLITNILEQVDEDLVDAGDTYDVPDETMNAIEELEEYLKEKEEEREDKESAEVEKDDDEDEAEDNDEEEDDDDDDDDEDEDDYDYDEEDDGA